MSDHLANVARWADKARQSLSQRDDDHLDDPMHKQLEAYVKKEAR